jgi:lysozyme
MGLAGFDPHAQDQAALFLIQRRGALSLADRGELTAELAAKLSPEWASFPTIAGQSFYGQPVRRLTELQRFYEANLARLKGRVSLAKGDGSDQAACNDSSLECALRGTERR